MHLLFSQRLRLFITWSFGLIVCGMPLHAAPMLKLKPLLPAVVEPKPAKPGTKPVPLTKDQQRMNIQSRAERAALDDLAKGNTAAAIRKYSSLAKTMSGTRLGGAIDLRILEVYRLSLQPTDSPAAFQKAILAAQEKYKDENILGSENKVIVQRINLMLPKMHRDLVAKQIQQAKVKSASPSVRKNAIAAIDTYLENSAPEGEKENLRAAKGELQYLSDNHIAAAAIFATLAEGAKPPSNVAYWRLAMRSQLVLASWPVDAPWDGIPKGSSPARETLKDMFQKIGKDDWNTVAQIGLLDMSLGHQAEAFKLFLDTLQKNSSGSHAQHAAGYMASSHLKSKAWPDLETLGRLMIKANLKGIHLKEYYEGPTLLGIALLEGGLERYSAADYKTAVLKLDEFVKGWQNHPRHDQAFYHLALAHHSNKSFKTALETMIQFTKSYAKSKYRKDALLNGGSWSLAVAWEDHVMYFLEAHIREFPKDSQVPASLETLANLYMGREVYDSAAGMMQLQLQHPQISSESKGDIARRLLDMQERQASPESAVRTADQLMKTYGTSVKIAAPALTLKARLQKGDSPARFDGFLKQLSSLPTSEPEVSEALSEVYFLKAEAMSKGTFEREVLNIESRNPLNDLNAAYSRYDQIRSTYEASCSQDANSWCGPAMLRLARVSEQFAKSIEPLDIPRTLGPEEVQAFQARKKSIIETADSKSLSADERAYEQAKAGATNPDWTGAIMWQNAADWQAERVSGETGIGYVQWHAGSNR